MVEGATACSGSPYKNGSRNYLSKYFMLVTCERDYIYRRIEICVNEPCSMSRNVRLVAKYLEDLAGVLGG